MADPAQGLAEGHPVKDAVYADRDPALLKMAPSLPIQRFNLRVAGADAPVVAEAIGVQLPDEIGRALSSNGRRALCLGPDEWYLTADVGAPVWAATELAGQLQPVLHSLVEISDRDVGIDISGRAAAEILGSGCPLDLWQMEPGHGTRTVFERAQIVVFKPAPDVFQIAVMRSFAPYLWTILTRSARQNAAIGEAGRAVG